MEGVYCEVDAAQCKLCIVSQFIKGSGSENGKVLGETSLQGLCKRIIEIMDYLHAQNLVWGPGFHAANLHAEVASDVGFDFMDGSYSSLDDIQQLGVLVKLLLTESLELKASEK